MPKNGNAEAAANDAPRFLRLERIYRANGVPAIAPGVYRLYDPALYGRGPYLLANRIAAACDGTTTEPEAAPTASEAAAETAETVRLLYVGANKTAHIVKAKGREFDVPRLTIGPDGTAQPRMIDVPAELAEEFTGRGTFRKAAR